MTLLPNPFPIACHSSLFPSGLALLPQPFVSVAYCPPPGDFDLYVAGEGLNSFYVNNGDFTFTDTTGGEETPQVSDSTSSVSFADVDRDGGELSTDRVCKTTLGLLPFAPTTHLLPSPPTHTDMDLFLGMGGQENLYIWTHCSVAYHSPHNASPPCKPTTRPLSPVRPHLPSEYQLARLPAAVSSQGTYGARFPSLSYACNECPVASKRSR